MSNLKVKTITMLLIAIFMTSTLVMATPVSAEIIEYSFSTTVGVQPVDVDVTDDGTHITWTIDYPLEAPYEGVEGNGLMTVGLVIALDGDGEGPAFQIHNNDGTDSSFVFGTWLMSPWDTTIPGNWEGWVSGFVNTLVTDLDWVTCTGERYNDVNPDGIFTISIDRAELGNDFHWALNLAIGAGFTTLTYEQMAYPVGNGFYGTPSFDWGNPLVDETIPNYEYAQIAKPDPKPKPNRHGIVLFDGVYMAEMWKTPHKLIVVEFPDNQESSYGLMITILTQGGEVTYSRTLIVSPHYDYLALYLHASVFPPNYVVVVSSTIGNLPYLVASREGIERSG